MAEMSRFIRNRAAAVIAVALLAMVWIVNLRSLLIGTAGASGPLPWHFAFMGRAASIVDLLFYAWIMWVAVAMLRSTRGKERWLVMSCLLPVLLIPARPWLVGTLRTLTVCLTTLSITTALTIALLILRDHLAVRDS